MKVRGPMRRMKRPPDAGEVGIRNIQVWVNAKGKGEKIAAVGLVAVEEIAVVKIPVGA
jgi:hypothetical protein